MTGGATVPTWGYRPDGSAEIFDLAPGEGLPDGWHPSPTVITDPTLATAEALSATIARGAEKPRPPAASLRAPEADAKGAKVSHPSQAPDRADALQAENARLVAEVAELRRGLAAVQAAHDEALARAEALAAQITALSAPAEQGGEGGEVAAADPAAPGSPPARTRDEARDAVRALLGEDLTDREIARRVGVSPSTVAAVRRAAGA